jgi:CBS domain containing-hemolysin-like protein
MLDATGRITIRLLLPYLSFAERLYSLALIFLVIYVVFSVAATVWSIRKNRASLHAENGNNSTGLLVSIRKRSKRVDRLITTAFYLFGFVLFSGLLNSYSTIDNSKIPTGYIILSHFEPHFAFAGYAFFTLFMLQIFGWFISSYVGRFALRSTPRGT